MTGDDPTGGIEDVLAFWFDERARRHWFDSTPAFDAEVRARLLPLHGAAAAGRLAAWRRSPRGCLALVVLLDQVPRNAFRGRPAAYATDPLAREVAVEALDRGFDAGMTQAERMMLYLPLEHSEDLADQERCVRLMETLDSEPAWADYARRHRDVIARFGRFPHRNAILGRPGRPAETAFLNETGTGW